MYFLNFRNYVANLYMEKGDLMAAKKHLDDSLKLQAKNPETLVRFAMNFYQIGNYKEAIKYAKVIIILIYFIVNTSNR